MLRDPISYPKHSGGEVYFRAQTPGPDGTAAPMYARDAPKNPSFRGREAAATFAQ